MTNDNERLAEIRTLYADDAEVVEHDQVLTGTIAISNNIGALQHRFGGLQFEIDGTVETHHGYGTWLPALAHRHLAVWSIDDPDERLKEINDLYAEDFELVEPAGLPAGMGRAGLNHHIDKLHEVFTDLEFAVDGPLDAHHGLITYRWIQEPPFDGRTVTGRDLLRVVDGQISLKMIIATDSSVTFACGGTAGWS